MFKVTPLDVIKVRLQAQQRPMTEGRCFIYCNGLMDHICKCEPLVLKNGSHAPVWYARPGNFSGTLVNNNYVKFKILHSTLPIRKICAKFAYFVGNIILFMYFGFFHS